MGGDMQTLVGAGDVQARSAEWMRLVRARKKIAAGEEKNTAKDKRCGQFEEKFNRIYANKAADLNPISHKKHQGTKGFRKDSLT